MCNLAVSTSHHMTSSSDSLWSHFNILNNSKMTHSFSTIFSPFALKECPGMLHRQWQLLSSVLYGFIFSYHFSWRLLKTQLHSEQNCYLLKIGQGWFWYTIVKSCTIFRITIIIAIIIISFINLAPSYLLALQVNTSYSFSWQLKKIQESRLNIIYMKLKFPKRARLDQVLMKRVWNKRK